MSKKIKFIFSNQILFYLVTRYLTYFLQFLVSIILAAKLGPYYSGVWGFVILLITYFGQIDFGISNSLNVLLVQNKDDFISSANYVRNAIYLNILISSIVLLFALYNYLFGIRIIQKYVDNPYFLMICLIAILQYFNTVFMTIFRVYNKLNQIIINQSIITLLTLLVIFYIEQKYLIFALILIYLVGNAISLAVYLFSFPIRLKHSSFSLKVIYNLVKKGLYLFIFNGSFYLIITSTRSLVSNYYSVEEFGVFSFAFTLSNSIMLFLGAFSFLIFPKLISKLSSNDIYLLRNTIDLINTHYTTFAHLLIYTCMIFFPIISWYFSEYSNILLALNVISLALLLTTNSFGNITLLIAQNRERTAAMISLFSLILNLVFGILIIKYFHLAVEYVIIASGLSFLVFSYLSCYFANLILNKNTRTYNIISDFFPLRLLAPFILTLFITLSNRSFLIITVLLFFLLINRSVLRKIIQTITLVFSKSNSINL